MSGSTNASLPPRRLGRSLWALLAGFLLVLVVTLATDLALHAAGIYPALGQPLSDALSLLATAYRTAYATAGSYLTARLAPYRPMRHAMIGGAIGFLLSIVGAVATWDKGLGPHWYPLALVATALPSAWLGGRLHSRQETFEP
jgi:hypothetical protein